ncbi:LacI family DNA-binding transcriptional regulator [Herbiconiux sp.]|uniref:LacI family DNA-binding transcriptional regulator n=1 Tax=Herbiconiux sp. TaxID=1871186 RepID=UPI0025C31A99|nr:LacI family DNA-binding transcriptional regulator [Herbiconiux sp.]
MDGSGSGPVRRAAVRLSDVAREAGVSAPLASRVLNGHASARAAAETKARILEVAERLGYVPNVAARSLRASRTGLIGLVVHDLSSPIYLELMRGARAEAAAHQYFLVLGDIDELLADDEAFNIFVNGRRVDGLIVQGGHQGFDQRIGDIARAVPTVVVNAPASPDETGAGSGSVTVSHVYPDEPSATRLLTEHLLDLGHTRIGLVSGPRDSMTNRLREKGIRDALEEAGLGLRPEDLVFGDWSADSGRRGLRVLAERWHDEHAGRPTALVAGNTLIGIGILGAAAEEGLRVPQDLSVAAVHDTWISEHLVPTLTTVSLPLHEVGTAAVRQLLAGSGSPRDVVLTEPRPVLHPRSSSARLQ